MSGPGPGLDSRAVSSIDLEPYFVSKDTGEANANGVVTFYVDDNTRTTLKLVYQLSQDPATGAYSYVPLPNPMTLSGVGTFQNAGGDNIAVYYFPFDQFGNQQLYYITVDDQFGQRQFTREAWPFPNAGTGGGGGGAGAVGITNQLSNPTFARVNFIPATTLTVTITGAGITTVPVAPDWDLVIEATGASSVTVKQTPIVGTQRLPNNPPYTLDFTLGANLTSVQLIQTLHNNPDWAAPQITGTGGFLSGSILLGIGTHVSMQYKPSAGNGAQLILDETNNTGAYAQVSKTIGLLQGANPQSGAVGFDQIIINILSATASISNVQIVPLATNISGVQYDQTPVNRQIDHLFNYYNDLLQYKPIPSYLVGWDFPLNPTQFLGEAVGPFATGANTSNYFWDQTIIFQQTDNSIRVDRNTADKSLNVFGIAATSFALVQYLSLNQVRNMLQNPLSVNICGGSGGFSGCVSLWVSTDANLPNMGANQSLVATLDATGKPATFNGNWTEIPRSNLGDAVFTIVPAVGAQEQDIGFSGWNMTDITLTFTANWFAVVVGIGQSLGNSSIDFLNISCVPGDIPTRPAPQSMSAVYLDCCRYYSKSFLQSTVPAAPGGNGNAIFFANGVIGAAQTLAEYVNYPIEMSAPIAVTIYSPINGSALIYNNRTGVSVATTTFQQVGTKGFSLAYTADAGSLDGDAMSFQWSADARLGF